MNGIRWWFFPAAFAFFPAAFALACILSAFWTVLRNTVHKSQESDEIMDPRMFAQVSVAVRAERDLWKEAIRNVRCILPDDADDLEREVVRLRRENSLSLNCLVGE